MFQEDEFIAGAETRDLGPGQGSETHGGIEQGRGGDERVPDFCSKKFLSVSLSERSVVQNQ